MEPNVCGLERRGSSKATADRAFSWPLLCQRSVQPEEGERHPPSPVGTLWLLSWKLIHQVPSEPHPQPAVLLGLRNPHCKGTSALRGWGCLTLATAPCLAVDWTDCRSRVDSVENNFLACHRCRDFFFFFFLPLTLKFQTKWLQ